jgi:RimJ/RimL family protein N-acetyltransferase
VIADANDIPVDGAPPHRRGAPSFAHVLATLDRHRWDAATLAGFLPALMWHLPTAPFAARERWLTALQDGCVPLAARLGAASARHGDVAFSTGVLAVTLGHWRCALACFDASLACCGQHYATHYNLAIVHWQLAQHDAALRHLQLAIDRAAGDVHYRAQLAELAAWQRMCVTSLGADHYPGAGAALRQIRATLLGPQYGAALQRLQNDPDVARLARVPQLDSVTAARHWIRRQLTMPHNTTLAMLDPDHGLIGVLAFERDDDAALFYYWVGRDLRQRGYGRAMLHLLRDLARARDIRWLYSSVYRSNVPSVRAMRGAGFRPLPMVADTPETPGDSLPYYGLALDGEGDDGVLCDRLQQLLRATDHEPAMPTSDIGRAGGLPC